MAQASVRQQIHAVHQPVREAPFQLCSSMAVRVQLLPCLQAHPHLQQQQRGCAADVPAAHLLLLLLALLPPSQLLAAQQQQQLALATAAALACSPTMSGARIVDSECCS
jgi:hypothetical protein